MQIIVSRSMEITVSRGQEITRKQPSAQMPVLCMPGGCAACCARALATHVHVRARVAMGRRQRGASVSFRYARGPQQPRGFPVQGQGAGLTRGKSRTAMPSWAAYSRTGSRTMSRPGHLCRHDVVAHDVGIEAQYVLCISHVFGTCYLL